LLGIVLALLTASCSSVPAAHSFSAVFIGTKYFAYFPTLPVGLPQYKQNVLPVFTAVLHFLHAMLCTPLEPFIKMQMVGN
jgi:hypothetical protein